MKNLKQIVTPLAAVLLMGTANNINAQVTGLTYNCSNGDITISGPAVSGGTLTTANKGWITGGNTLADTFQYFGTYNNDDIRIHTNNAACTKNSLRQRMIVTNTGNVGISSDGTNYPTRPQNKLFVENGAIGTPYTGLTVGTASITTPAWMGIFSVSKNVGTAANIPVFGYVPSGTTSASNLAVVGKSIGGSSSPSNFGVLGEAIANYAGTFNAGVRALGNGNGVVGIENYGGEFDARGASGANSINKGIDATARGQEDSESNIGVLGTGRGSSNSIGLMDVGVLGSGGDGIDLNGQNSSIYGVWGTVSGPGAFAYAVYGDASGTTATPAYGGYFNGDVFCSTGNYLTSDEKLKQNIQDYGNALEKIGLLNVKQYTFKQKEYPYMVLPQGEQVGIMAADLKKVFPNLVKKTIQPKIDPVTHKEDKAGRLEFDAVNYTALIPVLIQSVKELNQKVTTLEKRNVELEQKNEEFEKQLNELCASGCGSFAPNSSPINNTTGQNQLFQNVPNPFGQTTEIAYLLDASVKEAYIAVMDMKSVVLKRFDGLKGGGKVTVSTDGLTEGVYNYSLFANGKLIDTKKMAVAGNR